MSNKPHSQPREQLLAQLNHLKEDNQILSDTVLLLKEQLKQSNAQLHKYQSLYSQAQTQLQSLKNLHQQQHPPPSPILHMPPKPQSTSRVKPDFPYQCSIVTGSTNAKPQKQLQKKNSLFSDQPSQNDKQVPKFRTFKNIQAIERDRESSECGSKKSLQKKSSLNQSRDGVDGEKKRSIERRRSYFQKVSLKDK